MVFKAIHDPVFFDCKGVNAIRGRAPNAITRGDVGRSVFVAVTGK